MIARAIKVRLFDLLFADVRLCAAGDAYTGFLGSTRERTSQIVDTLGAPVVGGVVPTAGYVNVFERPHSKDSDKANPAIYSGTESFGSDDSQDGAPAISQNGLVERRALIVPLVLVCSHRDYYTAIAMRDQLVFNLTQILFDSAIGVGNPWYELRAPGMAGGGLLSVREWESTSGQGSQGVCEAYAMYPVRARYQRSKFSTKA